MAAKMQDLVKGASTLTGIDQRTVERVYKALLEVADDYLINKKEPIKLYRRGRFEIVTRKARFYYNPHTKRRKRGPAHQALHFVPSPIIREKLNK